MYERGFKVFCPHLGFTESHTLAVDVLEYGGGQDVSQMMEDANIVANKNLLPWDTKAKSPSRWLALAQPLPADVYAGAPYLRQMPTGETVLSAQVKSPGRTEPHMVVWVGDDRARGFANPSIPFDVPADVPCLWNSLFVKDEDTITAVAGTTMRGRRGLWMIDGRLVRERKR